MFMPIPSGLRAIVLIALTTACFVSVVVAQTSEAPVTEAPAAYTVQAGTHIPLGLINSVSTKHSVAGRSHLSGNRVSRS